jgi:hypothetical protein
VASAPASKGLYVAMRAAAAVMSGARLVVVDPKLSPPMLDPKVRARVIEAAGLPAEEA